QAIAQAEQFDTREPDNGSLQLTMASFFTEIGQPDRAERVLRAVIARSGKRPDGLAARDQLARLLASKQDVSGASALIAEVLAESPHDNDALVLRADLAVQHGDTTAAIADLRSVLRDQPNAVPVIRTLARAYQQNGEDAQAEEALRGVV